MQLYSFFIWLLAESKFRTIFDNEYSGTDQKQATRVSRGC